MMTLRSKGDRYPSRLEGRLSKRIAAFRSWLTQRVVVDDSGASLVFLCDTRTEVERGLSLWVKEEGTMQWLQATLKRGDKFLDIGANIGVYTLAAAHRVGAEGRVYAFEPHKGNVFNLLRNVAENGFADWVDVFSVPLSDRRKAARFAYSGFEAGIANNQLGDSSAAPAKSGKPQECVISMSVDELIALGAMARPDVVKIDVDGIEYDILRGMADLLSGRARPRSVQVEINLGENDKIVQLMDEYGYAVAGRHATFSGKAAISRGSQIEDIAHNAVFSPKPTA